ncbi:DUF512 domain-containing protein [Serpentinicella alkaliphila]|nr:DUF512 domain-containing protein [Serpentinicella alkaliphila]QUH27292.1 DUF512 domain-containing protein [Serpentinicella alkaliphila]
MSYLKETNVKNIISKVYPNSIAEEVGIEVGDVLVSINGEEIEDIIEYKFFLSDEYLEIAIEKADGEIWDIEIEKDYDEDLGIEFENPTICDARSCRNKCIFCFIDQLPKDMRDSLYFKDDDSRLSFLLGNYITLTNMSDDDINKIISYRISPINISVHTTNGDLRKKMLNNKFAGKILDIIHRFSENDINMNCQIVLCPDINDKQELDKTIQDLGKYADNINSVAVVPVGLTRFREGLFNLRTFTKDEAIEVINQVVNYQKQFKKSLGRNFVHLADEFYILADIPFPPYNSYDDFHQLENGVGLVVKFQQEFYDALNRINSDKKQNKKITVVTGEIAYRIIKNLCDDLMRKVNNLNIEVIKVVNHFFGGYVTVSGLVTGQDILDALKDVDLGAKLIIPESMLKSGEEVFLDDITISDLKNRLNREVVVSSVDGAEFVKKLLND